MSLKERGAITGIGETAYSRNSGKSVVALQMERIPSMPTPSEQQARPRPQPPTRRR